VLDAAMALFAERGYTRTTVGDIEREAGLSPRSGAMYQHFDSKQHVLHEALERQLDAVDDLQSVMDVLPLADLRLDLVLPARWSLALLDRRSELARFIRQEEDALPAALHDNLFKRLVARPYAHALHGYHVRPHADNLDDERLIATWVEGCLAYARAHGLDDS
jgi:AcrR family transcriptional regulator